MTNEKIKEIALENGFKLKEQPDGTQDLNPYVYEFAKNLMLSKLGQIVSDMTDLMSKDNTQLENWMLDRCEDIIERHIDDIG